MSNKIINPTAPKLDFRDVLIVPKTSFIESRQYVNLNAKYKFRYSRKEWYGVPIISSNMDSVTDLTTMKILAGREYLSCLPKHFNVGWAEAGAGLPEELKLTERYMLSCGIKSGDVEKVHTVMAKLEDQGTPLQFLCVDVANGHMFELIQTCAMLRDRYPRLTIAAGNVVTASAAEDLILDGSVDIVKVGIGSGQACLTRKMTGVGFPQLSAVLECGAMASSLHAHMISDGGISCAGDVAKAFGGGADFVMLGSYLAGHEESPGETTEDGYKLFYGMSSSVANKKHNGGMKNYRASEGRVIKLPCKGKLEDTLIELEGGVRSACTYTNSKSVREMYDNTKFILVNHQLDASMEKYTIST